MVYFCHSLTPFFFALVTRLFVIFIIYPILISVGWYQLLSALISRVLAGRPRGRTSKVVVDLAAVLFAVCTTIVWCFYAPPSYSAGAAIFLLTTIPVLIAGWHLGGMAALYNRRTWIRRVVFTLLTRILTQWTISGIDLVRSWHSTMRKVVWS